MDDTQKTQDPEELLTVKQFAEELNLTPQAIYKQLNTRLSPYLVEKNGVKMLKRQAILDIFPDHTEKSEKAEENASQEAFNQLSNSYQQLLNVLQTELKQKDDQIKSLQLLLSQQQQLLAQQQQINLLSQKQPDPPADAPVHNTADPAPVTTDAPKKSFWKRLFDL